MTYEDMDAAELRAELEEWTRKTLQWADDLADAIDAQDLYRAVFMVHAYRQARWQMRRIRHFLKVGVA